MERNLCHISVNFNASSGGFKYVSSRDTQNYFMREQLGQLSWDLYYSLTVVSFCVDGFLVSRVQSEMVILRAGISELCLGGQDNR